MPAKRSGCAHGLSVRYTDKAREKKIGMKLYQYCKFDDAKTIIDVEYLRLSIPSRMNDPFELLAQTAMEVKRYEYEADIKKTRVKKAFYRNMKNAGYPRSYSKFLKEMKNDPEYFFEVYKTNLPLSYREFVVSFLDDLSKKFGFLCLSKSAVNILMWSHYSEKHAGVTLGFETEKMSVQQKHLAFVDYHKDRIKIAPTMDPEHERNEGEWEKLLRRKHVDWSYEEEVRILGELNDVNQQGEYPVPFPKEALTEVLFGWKCKRRQEIIDQCKAKNYSCEFHQMRPHENEFVLVPEKIEEPI
jgi:hypothetical protein